jgi:hypothetical protein
MPDVLYPHVRFSWPNQLKKRGFSEVGQISYETAPSKNLLNLLQNIGAVSNFENFLIVVL